MSRLIATRVSDEAHSKVMSKCAGLGCSLYDYLKMLVETHMAERVQQTRHIALGLLSLELRTCPSVCLRRPSFVVVFVIVCVRTKVPDDEKGLTYDQLR